MDIGPNKFTENLAAALERKTNVALILGRIDDIGRIRDMHGLISCDYAIRSLEQILRDRFGDHSMRYGDGFRILLTGEDAAKASEIAELIRATVEKHQELVVPSLTAESIEVLPLDERIHITMHFGVTRSSSHWTSANGLNELLKEAEKAIHEGQRKLVANRVYETVPEPPLNLLLQECINPFL